MTPTPLTYLRTITYGTALAGLRNAMDAVMALETEDAAETRQLESICGYIDCAQRELFKLAEPPDED